MITYSENSGVIYRSRFPIMRRSTVNMWFHFLLKTKCPCNELFSDEGDDSRYLNCFLQNEVFSFDPALYSAFRASTLKEMERW